MKWQRGYRSENVEDRRGGGGGGVLGGGRRGVAVAGGGGIVALVLALLFGTDVFSGGGGASLGGGGAPVAPAGGAPADDDAKAFVSFVLDDVQGEWDKQFRAMGRRYEPAKLVLFTGEVASACGGATAAVGPFYCPGDNKAYIDLSFYDDLRSRFGAPGDFAQAYVLAHEIGHHVQTLLGVSAMVDQLNRKDPRQMNRNSVKQELQADCLAGIWAHGTSQRKLLEAGDIEEGLNAAAAIGDDTLQKRATGKVMPERFTHGTSAQRVRWFKRGYESGKVEDCDTFAASSL
ncbi:MAG: neutral zinc metallopeptidase [Myxococcales bacterium]|nr:neutral zinc metallopeptidase [Myxococcales bacterium]